ncbi:hypothetical protein JQX13_53050 [Archangium violaceum]|uniref:hypothetical protein n=1 Tax=Archangium violaceum TaxID=83451 RepID=UPI00193B8603|nr:hypothetical protein [Archangium violaceum]QRK08534.1 hypothetical protein JQX13_53050 [Archangium violaceum]
MAEGVLEYGKADGYEPPGCEHGCTPNLDVETRISDGLVGVACPNAPYCWPGWMWVPEHEVNSLRCRASLVFAALRKLNGLVELTQPVPAPFVAVGLLQKRGCTVPVVWLRSAKLGFEQACLGLRKQLGGDGLIVLVAKDPRVPFHPSERIAVLELLDGADGHLGLVRGLDMFDPDYRTRAASRENSELDVDFIHLRFETQPDRHVLLVNGHDFGGFRKSDVLFTQLLLLAAGRIGGRRDGWRNKAALVGDFTPRPAADVVKKANKALERLREELASHDVPGLSEDELDAIIKAGRGTGRVRLGVPPENIVLDASLANFSWVSMTTTTTKSGRRIAPNASQEEGIEKAALLLSEARRLGAPGSVDAVPPLPAMRRRSSHSGT